jgi:tRNA pseudouridine38-40 synthase
MADRRQRAQVLLRFGYDGAPFFGLNPQPGLPTAGGALRARIEAAAGGQRAGGLVFAARTDRGVSARGNLATCWFPELPDWDGFLAALCAERADGLRGLRAWRVPWDTHARGISVGKRYVYRLGPPGPPPPGAPPAWRPALPLRPGPMREAARALLGTHDFAALRGGSPDDRPTTRSLWRADLIEADGEMLFVVEGDGFLRQMVRVTVGTLVEVGAGLRDPASLPALLQARRRVLAGTLAPPEPLCLDAVFLKPDLQALLAQQGPGLPQRFWYDSSETSCQPSRE